MKIDIEGAESDVAEVSFFEVTDRLKSITLEFHPQFIKMRCISPSEVLRKFKAQDFNLHTHRFQGPLAKLATYEVTYFYIMIPKKRKLTEVFLLDALADDDCISRRTVEFSA